MIIVKLQGGFGNQLFQFAAGVAMAKRLNAEMKVDTCSLLDRTPKKNFTYRDFELNAFKIAIEEASSTDKEKYFPNFTGKKSILSGFLIRKVFGTHYICEKTYKFDKRFFTTKGNVYLDGYWQSEKYFDGVAPLIREKYLIDNLPKVDYEKIIINTDAICVHIRRGDYVSNPKAASIHGICGIDYYRNAADYISKKLSNPTYCVFSDDIPWCKENLKFTSTAHFITSEISNGNPHIDFRLMARCKHFIISNSSFAWWAAWLGGKGDNYNEKIVLAPKKWFAKSGVDPSYMIPKQWTCI